MYRSIGRSAAFVEVRAGSPERATGTGENCGYGSTAGPGRGRKRRRAVVLVAVAALSASCSAVGRPAGAPVDRAPPAPAAPTTGTAPAPTTGPPGPSTTEMPVSGSGPYWLVQDYTVAALIRNGMAPAQVTALFDNPRTLLIVKGSAVDGLLRSASRVATFTSFASLQAAIQAGTLPAGTKYVLYDDEDWTLTPVDEQQHPAAYAERARTLLHQHGLRLIFTPGVNLATVIAGTPSAQKYASYLTLGLAANGARASDVFEIQAQQAVATPGFAGFVTAAVAQAKAANPGAPVLIGLSTNPLGHRLTAADLLGAYRATRSEVDGYWLNVPGGGPNCPACGQGQPQVAVSFLESLGATG